MNTELTPGPTWTQIGLELAAIRTTARREKRRYGGVSEATQERLRAAMLKAQVALELDAIAERARSAA